MPLVYRLFLYVKPVRFLCALVCTTSEFLEMCHHRKVVVGLYYEMSHLVKTVSRFQDKISVNVFSY